MDTIQRVAFAALLVLLPVTSYGATISRVSLSSAGVQPNDYSYLADASENGRFYAFTSSATNLVPGDTNGVEDVFVRDRETGVTTRVSLSTGGAQGNSDSLEPAISADGRFVAFLTFASNLFPNDSNGDGDVVLHDRATGTTTLVSASTAGVQSNDFSCNPAISADGSVVVFFSDGTNVVAGDTNGVRDIFTRVVATGVTTRVSVSSTGVQTNDNSFLPAVSATGRYVSFHSFASTLVSGDTNGVVDVFLHDRMNATTTRVSVSNAGLEGDGLSRASAISGDGNLIAFESDASNLVTGDTNGVRDVFVRNRQAATTTRVSVSGTGAQGNGTSAASAITLDGRYVAFESNSTNLVSGDTNGQIDIFVHDRNTGQKQRASMTSTNGQANGNSADPSFDSGGRYLSFLSNATNLVAGDTNGASDIFLVDAGSTPSDLVAAVLPTSRSVVVNGPATAFATIINTAGASRSNCSIGLADGAMGGFLYQTTNPATNALSGTPNTPVTIPGSNGSQSFFLSITPAVAFEAQDVGFTFDCNATAPAAVQSGLNTLLLSAAPFATPDIIALAATPTADGIIDLPGNNGANAFAVATANVGVSGNITAAPDTGAAALPLAIFICRTNAGGECLATPAASVNSTIGAGATPTYSIFVNGAGNVPLDPANNRVFVRFEDAGGMTRGATSVAVRTVP